MVNILKQCVLEVEIELLEDGRYIADCPDFEGCHAEGDTPADALENLEEVARMTIDLCREKGLPLPPEYDESTGTDIIKTRMVLAA
ncbi:MAG TPA: type II toxin-antitoxin system HicB family antitoxin [Dehalococcoidia bacterium]|jgi:predicted RNase H-like HicB family nuclease|nr:type II toxin-antitoxin system HicB family antitoxin [Dehalococcoidia bacterium]